MSDSETYKGWKISQPKNALTRALSENHHFVAIEINSPSGRMISGDSVGNLKAEIDKLPR